MSALRITHETIYDYVRPVRFGAHRLVLRPREGHDLQVERMSLAIEPSHSLEWHRDVFGNSIVTVEFLTEASQLRILSEVDVRRFDLPRIAERNDLLVPYPVVYDAMEATFAYAYLQLTYPEEFNQVSQWAQASLLKTDRMSALSIVSSLNEAVRNQIKYNRREEKGVQTPVQTITKGSGSCRDMATLLMDACRTLGLAARFSSGYLDCAASQAGRASTHAWAEVYFPRQGWLGFDPTLGEQISAKHITIGLSNHPRGVMPVSGSFFGASSDYIGMKVAVAFLKPQ